MLSQKSRRIFHSGPTGKGRGGIGRTVAAGLIGAVGGAALMLIALPAELFGRVPVLSGTLTADAPQIAVVDGDTLRVRDTVLRLKGVSAPRRGQICQRDDGTGYDCGAAATEALAGFVRGHLIACELNGRDVAGHPLAMCESGGRDVNRAMVAGGWARAQVDAPAFGDDEAGARARQVGLWQSRSAKAS